MSGTQTEYVLLLRALRFAAERHRTGRRKDTLAAPYINHPIAVAAELAEAGVDDEEVLAAAFLHDTVEDTSATPEEIEREFGPRVRALVDAVTDDKSLPSRERKRLQEVHAPHLDSEAKLIKIADKTCNVHDVGHLPPTKWSIGRRREYLDWTERVIAGCRGVNATLEARYDAVLSEARAQVEADAGARAAAGTAADAETGATE